MSPRVGVVLFPGSNCEQDAMEAVRLLGGGAIASTRAEVSAILRQP